MKKMIGIALCLCLLLTMAVPVCAAAGNARLLEYDYIDTVTANLEINRFWGVASCDGAIAANDIRPVYVEVSLQQYTSNGWEILQTWTSSGQHAADAGGDYAIAKGYQYRTYTVGYVYDDSGTTIIDCGSATYGLTFE